VADFAIRLSFTDKLGDFWGKTIRFQPLARAPTEYDAAPPSRGDAGSNPLTQQIPPARRPAKWPVAAMEGGREAGSALMVAAPVRRRLCLCGVG
jgi:hypothetical protein